MERLILAVPVLLLLLAIAAILAVIAFEVWMLVELIQDNSISSEVKLLWAIGMLFFHPFVAIAYFFVSRNRR